jgi:hypothetical protein
LVVEPTAWPVAAPLARAPDGPPASAVAWILGAGPGAVRLTTRPGSSLAPDNPLAAIIPLDGTLPARLAALARLWRILGGRPPEDPLTPQRRGRLKTMLRAFDARRDGASYRQIASGLYGEGRVEAEPWKTSSLRDATMRLVRDARGMASGGYLALLR